MIRSILVWLLILSLPASADKYEKWARDFIVIRARTEACVDAAKTHADAVACAGKATAACLGESSDWPYPEPRDCKNEDNVWQAIYMVEQMKNFQRAHALDLRDLYYDSAAFASRMDRTMEAEQTWRLYAWGHCGVEAMIDAEKSYEERQALHPRWCMARMYAERIVYLRGPRNWLSGYRP
jgi:hypothetical protein